MCVCVHALNIALINSFKISLLNFSILLINKLLKMYSARNVYNVDNTWCIRVIQQRLPKTMPMLFASHKWMRTNNEMEFLRISLEFSIYSVYHRKICTPHICIVCSSYSCCWESEVEREEGERECV